MCSSDLTTGAPPDHPSFLRLQEHAPPDNPHTDGACIETCGRVEERRGVAGTLAVVPFPLPAHRTQRADFPHYALRLASLHGTRLLLIAIVREPQVDDTALAEYGITGEATGATAASLVPPLEEEAH